MGCFTCGKEFNNSEIAILERYKSYAENTGQSFWYYKIKGINEINITTSDDFKNFRKDNATLFKAEKIEFANILEFGNTSDIGILGSAKNE